MSPSNRLQTLQQQIQRAKDIASSLSAADRNKILSSFREGLLMNEENILKANKADLEAATNNASLSPALLKRLVLDARRLQSLVASIDALIAAPSPLGKCTLARELTPGLNLYRVTVPLGAILIIFEGRPEAFVQIAALGLKSGNVCLLKGGKECHQTNSALYEAYLWGIRSILNLHMSTYISAVSVHDREGLSSLLLLIESREETQELLQLHDSIDLVIPRGSKQLVNFVSNNTRIPVMGHAEGVCTAYADADCCITQQRLQQCINILKDSKLQYVGACNALEVLLVHEDAAGRLLPLLGQTLSVEGVRFRADEKAETFLPSDKTQRAIEEDFRTEWLAPILSVKVVKTIHEAINNINTFGSHHTDLILSFSPSNVEMFMRGVGSADVFCNCSTRFADGFRFGFQAEVGIATGKTHARGPVGIEGLCTYAYRLYGRGHTVESIESEAAGASSGYTHKPILLGEPSNLSNHAVPTEQDIDAYECRRLLAQ